jgi:prevent-host-death family protein
MKTVTALMLRKRLGQVLDEVAAGGEPVLITRGNRPLVVLVAAERYRAAGAERRDRLEAAAARVAEWRARYGRGRGLDPVALVRKDRDAR